MTWQRKEEGGHSGYADTQTHNTNTDSQRYHRHTDAQNGRRQADAKTPVPKYVIPGKELNLSASHNLGK